MKQRVRISLLLALSLVSCRSVLGIDDPIPCEADCVESGAGGQAGIGTPSGGAPAGGTESDEAGTAGIVPQGGQAGEVSVVAPQGGEAGMSGSSDGGAGSSSTGGSGPVGGASSAGGGSGGAVAGSAGASSKDCAVGETRCVAYQPQACQDGAWVNQGSECAGFCSNGACDDAPSCKPGLLCGTASCCDTIWVEGGTYEMGKGDVEVPDLSYTRTVAGFYLDRFEVTVGRFKQFMAHFSLPKAGEGAFPKVGPSSGWNKDWEALPHPDFDGQLAVAATTAKLVQQLTDDCDDGSTAALADPMPSNCVNWYAAFAFCVYDHGRLPTEAEWNYAAAAGDRQLPYPWSQGPSDKFIDLTKADYLPNGAPYQDLPVQVGSKHAGSGFFHRYTDQGFEDLAGNVGEWTLDRWSANPTATCANCIEPFSKDDEQRAIRDGNYSSLPEDLLNGHRASAPASYISSSYGFRCARDVETSTPE